MKISNHEQLATEIRKDLMSMDGMTRSEWLATIDMTIDGELDGTVEYWAEIAEQIGYDEDSIRSLISEIADYIKSSEEYNEVCKIAEHDENLDNWDDED